MAMLPNPSPPGASLRLVFRGECLPGHAPQDVRQAVAQALKLGDDRAARLFSGRSVVLRREVDSATAARYVGRFAKMGALLHVESVMVSPVPPVRPASRPLSWQPSRPVITGLAGLAVVLLLAMLLWPGVAAWWGPAAPDPEVAALPQAVAPQPAGMTLSAPATVPSPSPASMPAGPVAGVAFDDELPTDMGPQALRDYRQHYLPAAGHKAFAIGGQAHAWQAGAASENDAREAALTRCMRVLRPGESACRVVDANGQLTE